MIDKFQREIMLVGEENFSKINNSSVLVVGLGGVGSAAVEALARAGVSTIGVLDYDIVDVTNINRQLIALNSTIGMKKTQVIKNRILDINEKANVITYDIRLTKENISQISNYKYDYIIDAIDMVTSKIELIKYASENNIGIISSMGTGKKINPLGFKVDKIKNTKGCPLARVMRKKLGELGIKNVKVLYSEEKAFMPDVEKLRMPSSISFVPPVCGMILASEVIKSIINDCKL
ncbi:MAG: hypothetical protein CSB15_00675 [Clostridiales bacterium]|nr:MAG: hypothetical protein CSB15_00675 [Clostridiales bacterium]